MKNLSVKTAKKRIHWYKIRIFSLWAWMHLEKMCHFIEPWHGFQASDKSFRHRQTDRRTGIDSAENNEGKTNDKGHHM